jgi:hypothetical protein
MVQRELLIRDQGSGIRDQGLESRKQEIGTREYKTA